MTGSEPGPAPEPSADPFAEDELAETVVVDRVAEDELAETIVVDRVAEDELARTVVVERAPTAEHPAAEDPATEEPDTTEPDAGLDRTVPVDRAPAPLAGAAERPTRGVAKNRARRIRIALPDGTEPSLRAAEGAGVGAVDRYSPRALPPVPEAEHSAEPDGPATRVDAPGMPSVRRASRRAARTSLLVALAAVVLSVLGLVWIATLLLAP